MTNDLRYDIIILYGCGIAHPTLFYSEVVRIGALPSQKYEHILIAYQEYLLQYGVRIPNGTLKEFLRKCDKKEISI